MIHISPEQFRKAFEECAALHSATLADRWDRAKDYTTFMRETLLTDVAVKLGLKSYTADYYTLDAVFYEAKDDAHFGPNTTYAKYLAVAIEHENDARSTYVEMNKLQLFNTPLKVLITYNGGPGHERELKTLLHEYATIVQEADAFGDFSTSRRVLLIIGEKPSEQPTWHYFSYVSGRFESLG